ncbi:MAG: hypothetical protein ABH967_01270 [Patescibacteria group bacterium]
MNDKMSRIERGLGLIKEEKRREWRCLWSNPPLNIRPYWDEFLEASIKAMESLTKNKEPEDVVSELGYLSDCSISIIVSILNDYHPRGKELSQYWKQQNKKYIPPRFFKPII